jgi:tetratricopeptide (TPR) repeat protein
MLLAENQRPDTEEARPWAERSEEWLEKYLTSGPVDKAEEVQVVIVGQNVAGWYLHKELTDAGLRLLGRVTDIARATNQPEKVGAAQIVMARALRSKGDLEGALATIRQAVTVLEPSPSEKRPGMLLTFSLALGTQGEILGEDNAVSLGRSREAVQFFERSFRISTDLARLDANDAFSRRSLSGKGISLAGVLRHSDPHRAIAIYDEVLDRLAEIKNNSEARRDEVKALAWSTYPLRQIGRSGEARKRLDIAFSRLSDLKLYPSQQVKLGSEPEDALRALAEYEAGSGKIRRGIEIYQQLVRQIMASQPKPESDLADATSLANIYTALAALHHRAGQDTEAMALEARRLELWRHWTSKLPNNSFVLRQLTAKATP